METIMRKLPPALFLFSAVFMMAVSLLLLTSVPGLAKGIADMDDSSGVEERSQEQKEAIPFISKESEETIDETQTQVSEHLITAAT